MLPDGLAQLPPGPALAVALASVERSRVASADLHVLARARSRQVAYEQAALLADMLECGGQIRVAGRPRGFGHRRGHPESLGGAAGLPGDVVCGEQSDRECGRIAGRLGQLDCLVRGPARPRIERRACRVAVHTGECRQHPRPQRCTGTRIGLRLRRFKQDLGNLAGVGAGPARRVSPGEHLRPRTGPTC